jgi:prepilin-type N-terminal cleavage/methylation domain-containing protein
MIQWHDKGFTLIEMVIFIAIISLIGVSLLQGINQAILYSHMPTRGTEASFLANARMQVILMNRQINGYTSLSDPCTTTPALAICTPLSTYASNNGFTVSTPTISGSNPKSITLSVTGAGNATINANTYNYANN